MEFDNLKKIWDTQNNQHIFAIDEEALHRLVIKKNIGIRRMANISEWGIFLIALMLATFMIIDGILDNQIHKFPQAVIFLVVAGYVLWDRKKRLTNEGQSDRTLHGDLEQAIRTVDYYIKRQRNFLWWFLVPAAITILINMGYNHEGKSGWVWLLVVAAFTLSYWLVRKELHCKILPNKDDLISLRDQLVETER